MLKPDQIEALRGAAEKLLDPVADYLIEDIAKRVAKAGQLTATAQYQIWRAQQLGVSQFEVKKRVAELLKISQEDAARLFEQAAETGYRFDLNRLPTARAIPFQENTVIQQIVRAAVDMAGAELENITQSLGFVGPDGRVEELTAAFLKACDFAFMQATTGAESQTEAVRNAVRGLRNKGIQWIDYESGKSYSVEAAVRRNVYSAAGIMQEKIGQWEHDATGCDGWEISAHTASAPDHEPIQGKQYSDEAYTRLNNSLIRRIGTLNCGHTAFPIILGVSIPTNTPEELAKMAEENEKGFEYNGKHYTRYEATQRQRYLERKMREDKRKLLIDEATGDSEALGNDQIQYIIHKNEYKRFSEAAGLKLQPERAEMAGFGPKQAGAARKAYKELANKANALYDTGTEEGNIAAYRRDLPIRERIKAGELTEKINQGEQRKHIPGKKEYNDYVDRLKQKGEYGPARVTIAPEKLAGIVDRYKGTGILQRSKKGEWTNKEIITMNEEIVGVAVNNLTGAEAETPVFKIHYSEDGYHVVPDYPSKKGAKAKK